MDFELEMIFVCLYGVFVFFFNFWVIVDRLIEGEGVWKGWYIGLILK